MVRAEAGSTMSSRLSGSRGPQRFLLLAALLVTTVVGLNYWRLAGTNTELRQQIHRLQQLLEQDAGRRDRLEGELQRCKDNGLKTAVERDRLQHEHELNMQRQTEKLDNLEQERTNCGQQAQHHQQELMTAQAQLEAVRHNLTHCLTQSCGDRVKQLQFDLDTCRFAQKHVGNPGIIRPAGDGPGARGVGQLPVLSPAAVSVQQSALRGMHYPGGPILLSDPPDSYRPPPRLSVAAAAAVADPGHAAHKAGDHSADAGDGANSAGAAAPEAALISDLQQLSEKADRSAASPDAKPALADGLPESRLDEPFAAAAAAEAKGDTDEGAAGPGEEDKADGAAAETAGKEEPAEQMLANIEEPAAADAA